ncbi:hypothetical protein ACH5RR_031611 [Cinchona calisaya]|uniref:Uncharacterized protein n=1 Tax=Cinchona calisaya TaxID=153742 RepID=A0ABD2YIK3_9GENT
MTKLPKEIKNLRWALHMPELLLGGVSGELREDRSIGRYKSTLASGAQPISSNMPLEFIYDDDGVRELGLSSKGCDARQP